MIRFLDLVKNDGVYGTHIRGMEEINDLLGSTDIYFQYLPLIYFLKL